MTRLSVLAVLVLSPVALSAQTRLDRSPNLGGTWVAEPGVLQFNFIHRFYVSPDPYVVQNYPTFTLAKGLTRQIGLGLRYSTRSTAGIANEAELFARWQVRRGGPNGLTVAVTPAYNTSAQSFDVELGLDWNRGPFTLSAAARGMSQPYDSGRARVALAGGAVYRLNDYVALAGDVASLLDTRPGEKVAWSAGLLLAIPSSPHTFSLHASNVVVNTTAGSSRGASTMIYGFEFTIPIRLSRFGAWFHGRRQAAAPAGPADVERTVEHFSFGQDTVVISVGQSVAWTNQDAVEHTLTFSDGQRAPLLKTGERWLRRFDAAGTYTFHCEPHPYMTGVVVVR